MKRGTISEVGKNVFLDLGFDPAEAQNLLLRSHLMLQLRQVIKKRKLTQIRAAKLFGVTQPRISDLLRGKIDRFSIDGLISMLGHAGLTVTFRIKSAA